MYEEEYWNQQDPDGKKRNMLSDEERKLKLELAKDEIAFINALPPGRLLDYGCGLGHMLSRIDNKHEKWGCDISEFAIREAKKLNPNVKFTPIDRLSPIGFDIILCYHVLEHLDRVAGLNLLFILSLALNSNGRLILGTPCRDSYMAQKWMKYRMMHDKTHIQLWTENELRIVLQVNDMVVERVEFPFFGTRYDTPENRKRATGPADDDWSPPFAGNIMTIYARKVI